MDYGLSVPRPTGLLLEFVICFCRLGNSPNKSSILGLIWDLSWIPLSKFPESMEWAFRLHKKHVLYCCLSTIQAQIMYSGKSIQGDTQILPYYLYDCNNVSGMGFSQKGLWMRGILMADLRTAKKIAKAKCSEQTKCSQLNWLCVRKSKLNSIGKKWGTSRVIKILRITSLILTEESPKKLTRKCNLKESWSLYALPTRRHNVCILEFKDVIQDDEVYLCFSENTAEAN